MESCQDTPTFISQYGPVITTVIAGIVGIYIVTRQNKTALQIAKEQNENTIKAAKMQSDATIKAVHDSLRLELRKLKLELITNSLSDVLTYTGLIQRGQIKIPELVSAIEKARVSISGVKNAEELNKELNDLSDAVIVRGDFDLQGRREKIKIASDKLFNSFE